MKTTTQHHAEANDIFREDRDMAKMPRRRISIGVAGCMPRIGTTTQALLITSYLFYHDKSVVYAELTDNDFIRNLEETYTDVQTKNGVTVYNRLSLVRKEQIPGLTDDVEYVVYDYGAANVKGFDAVSFSRCDIKLLCGGSKPNELLYMTQALGKDYAKDCYYMFSFVPRDDEQGIIEQMGKLKDRTFFSSYSPDYFTRVQKMDVLYNQFIPLGGK